MIVYDNIFQESKISAKQRDSLKDSDFGIPDKREYPLTDEEHVRKAVQMFSYADESDRHELAERIVLKAKKFGMNWENWLGIRRYLPDSYKQHIQESVTSDYLYQSDTTSKTLTEYSKNVTGIDDASIVLEGSQSRKTQLDYIHKLNTCKELYKRWSQFKYGIPVDGHVKNVSSVEYYDQHYRFLSPEEFVKYGGGICWDFVEYGRKFLLKKRIKFKTFYISTSTKHGDTHTIIVCESNGKLIYPESSFKLVADDMDGVGIFDTYDELFKYITNWMFEINDNKKYSSKFNYYVWEYKDHPPYGCNSNEFTSFVTKGEPDFEGVAKYKNVKEGNNMRNDFYDLPENPINIMEMDIDDDINSKTDDLPSKDQDSDDDSKTDDDSDKKITSKDDEDKDDEDEDEDKDDDNETDDDDDDEEDAEDEDDKDEENDGDDLESFGSDTDGSTPDNEYNENEIKILNDLIADEEQAMSGYYHGALNSKIDILTRLYANIGDEERFHAEQLMYAKSTITGEKYSPQDPKVKSEYEDLLKMGMDEETAMSTAIDKRNMVDDDDEDDSDMEDIEDDVSVIESAIYQNELLMAICEYKISTVEDCDAAFGLFIESYIYMEEMDNVSSALGKSQRAANPLKLLMKGVNALIKMLMQLSRKTRDYINKSKIRRKRKFDWIKKHGIKDLFASGVSLYFYSEKTASFDVEEAIRYVDLLYRITKMVAANTGMRLKEPAKYKTIRNPIPFKTTDAAINILHGIVLTKTKVILTDNSEAAILEELFGYKENKLRVGTSRGEDEPIIHESGNFYNRMEALISLTTEYANVANAVVDMLSRFEGDTNSIYYKNRSLYNNATRVMQEVGKSYNTILGAMTHDLNTVMKLDNGILEMSRNRDRIEQTGGQWTGPTSNPSVQAKTNSNKYVERK